MSKRTRKESLKNGVVATGDAVVAVEEQNVSASPQADGQIVFKRVEAIEPLPIIEALPDKTQADLDKAMSLAKLIMPEKAKTKEERFEKSITNLREIAADDLDGFNPINSTFSRNEEEWAKTLTQLDSVFTQKLNKAGNTPVLPRAGYSFRFEAKELDNQFRYQQVEFLLDQAADFLDRGIRLRAEFNELSAKAFNLFLELKEYVELDGIHREETEAGFYEKESKQSDAAFASETAFHDSLTLALNFLKIVIEEEFSDQKKGMLSDFAQREAFASHLKVYHDGLNNFVGHVWNNDSETVPNHLLKAAQRRIPHDLRTQTLLLNSQFKEMGASVNSSLKKLDGLLVRLQWDLKDRSFRLRRTEIARMLADLKTKAANEDKGCLNYSQQALAVEKRFNADFRDGYARLKVVSDGIRQLYGFDQPLPAKESDTFFFDDCLLWARDAINHLVRFNHVDQNYVLAVSVASLSGTKWAEGLKTGVWQFELPDSLFPNQTHVRLRGLSVFTVFENEEHRKGVWHATLSAPKKAFYRRPGGAAIELDQTNVPQIRVGRVTDRESSRDPDVVGVIAWHNVSPIGSWELQIAQTSTAGIALDKLKDINIDLHVAVQSL